MLIRSNARRNLTANNCSPASAHSAEQSSAPEGTRPSDNKVYKVKEKEDLEIKADPGKACFPPTTGLSKPFVQKMRDSH